MQNVHLHKPDWHIIGMRFDHIIHDSRFWAGLALVILVALMIVTMILFKPSGGITANPSYPYMP